MPNGRCYRHGGATPSGPASPHFIHGRYSAALPAGLAARFAESISDPGLLELNAEIALVGARTEELLGRVQRQDTVGHWSEADSVKVFGFYAASMLTELQIDHSKLLWDDVGVPEYDLVRGVVSTLKASGFTAATEECLADNTTATSTIHTAADPPLGEAFWYTVRVVLPSGPHTYDSSGEAQAGARDPGIDASSDSCS